MALSQRRGLTRSHVAHVFDSIRPSTLYDTPSTALQAGALRVSSQPSPVAHLQDSMIYLTINQSCQPVISLGAREPRRKNIRDSIPVRTIPEPDPVLFIIASELNRRAGSARVDRPPSTVFLAGQTSSNPRLLDTKPPNHPTSLLLTSFLSFYLFILLYYLIIFKFL